MKSGPFLPLCLAALLTSACTAAQSTPATSAVTPQATASPVAYVYVSTITSGSNMAHINGYSAAADGRLTLLPGSPYRFAVTSMAATHSYLFAVDQSFLRLDTFRIASNGSLTSAHSLNDETATNSSCTDVQRVILDHSGANLYVFAGDQDCTESPADQSFFINKTNGGALQYLSTIGPNRFEPFINTFTANNVYGYGATCDSFGSPVFLVGKRGTNGSLTPVSAHTPSPTPSAGQSYCPFLPQADPTDHLAVVERSFNLAANTPTGNPDQIASYTVDAAGNLTTTSTHTNMPQTLVLSVNDIGISPSGKVLAVGGKAGLQIFHFNGAAPITLETGLLTRDQINQVYWDNANHLYAISYASQRLHVYTVTSSNAVQAPGSPYSITNPSNLVVQPR